MEKHKFYDERRESWRWQNFFICQKFIFVKKLRFHLIFISSPYIRGDTSKSRSFWVWWRFFLICSELRDRGEFIKRVETSWTRFSTCSSSSSIPQIFKVLKKERRKSSYHSQNVTSSYIKVDEIIFFFELQYDGEKVGKCVEMKVNERWWGRKRENGTENDTMRHHLLQWNLIKFYLSWDLINLLSQLSFV